MLDNNIQKILDGIAKSDFSNPNNIHNVAGRKKIYVFQNGILIETLLSMESAYEKYGKQVKQFIKKKIELRNGQFFSYENEYNPTVYSNDSHLSYSKPLLVYYKGEFYGEFKSIKETAKELNLKRTSINHCLKGYKGQKTYKGFSFEYKKID